MRTTTKHNIVVIAVSLVIAASIPLVYKKTLEPRPNVFYHSFHGDHGWGYDIIMNDKLVIHQQYVPALNVKQQFPTREQAEAAAQLVVFKLKNNKFPTLSKSEVEQICGIVH